MQNDRVLNKNITDDEISIREILEILLKGKRIIAITAIISVILAAVYTFGFLKPIYQSEALLTIDFKESVDLSYGSYIIPINKMVEYTALVRSSGAIRLTLRDLDSSFTRAKLLSKLSVEPISNTTSFLIKAKGVSPEEAYNIASQHTDNYLLHLEITIRRMAIDHFFNSTTMRVRTYERELVRNEHDTTRTRELLATIPSTLNVVNALISEAEYALIYSSIGEIDLSKIKGDKIITQVLNPSYLTLMEKITELEIIRVEIETNLQQAQKDLEDLQAEKVAITLYNETLATDQFSTGLESLRGLVTVVSRPEIENQKIGPRNAVNLAIGAILGLMLGVFAAFFKGYWENSL